MSLTRRMFTRQFAAMSTLSSFIPGLTPKIGARSLLHGWIRPHFAATLYARLPHVEKSKVTALVSGHRDKAEKYAADYGIPAKNIYNYENYNQIAQNSDIDAVYIALPNSMHAEYSIRAAKAGKHIFCEKPMATSVKDAQAMIDACRGANKKLIIAYRCQYEPTNLRAIELIRSGKLGKIQAIESANGFNETLGACG